MRKSPQNYTDSSIHACRMRGWCARTVAAILVAPLAHAQQTDSSQQAGANDEGLTEIIVTATRREESVQSIPFQVSAMSGNDLSQINAHNIGDFAAFVPGLTTYAGEANPGLVVIRGITTGSGGTGQLGSAIGVYLDDIPLGASSPFGLGWESFNVSAFDLDRIEVLNGPQGTLYGANSLGGSLKYITTAPDPGGLAARVEVEGSNTAHGGNNDAVRGVLNAPIGNDLGALRVVAIDEYNSGFMTDPVHGRDNLGTLRTEGARALLQLAPADSLDVRLSGYYQHASSSGLDDAFRDFATGQPTALGRYGQSYPLPQSVVSSLKLYSATVRWSLPWFTATSISGYQVDHGTTDLDETLVYGTILAPLLDPVGEGADPWDIYVNTTTRKFTQELRVVSAGEDRFRWIVGGYYSNEHTEELVDVFDKANAGGTLLGLPPFDDSLPSSYRELAGYADATISFTKRLSVGLGVRYSTQHQTYHETIVGLLATGSGAVYASPVAVTDQNVTTYSVNPQYQLTAHSMVYARAASGFRPGGPNFELAPGLGNPSFAPDKLWNYEVGEKSTFFDQRLLLNFDVYDIEWQNIQVVVNVGGINQLENAGKGRVRGAELTFKDRVLPALTVGGSAAFTDAHLTSPAPVLNIDYSGARLPLSPRFNFALLGTYNFALASNYTAALTLTDRWLGERTEGFGTVSSPRYKLGAFNTVDLDLSLAMPHGFSADFYVKNLFDTPGEIDATLFANEYNPNAPTPVELTRPRTIGLVLRASL